MTAFAIVNQQAPSGKEIVNYVDGEDPFTTRITELSSWGPLSAQARAYSLCNFTHQVDIYNGSVASVSKAVDSTTGSPVVIKVYHKNKMQQKHHHKLIREIECMQRMAGPYVTQLYNIFQDTQCVCLVMELCEAGDLFKTLMRHGGRLPEHVVCVEYIVPLLRVLEKMHSLGFMHRDIKPENIFLKGNQTSMRLGDFGLAIDWNKEIPFSRSGTLDYMAPEVLINPATQLQESASVTLNDLAAKNIRPFCSKVDIWAVGVLAYELIAGRPPFEVADEAKTVTRIIYDHDIKFPASFPEALRDFVRHALIKDPNSRPGASKLLTHPWIIENLSQAMNSNRSERYRKEKASLFYPLPLSHNTSISAAAPQILPMKHTDAVFQGATITTGHTVHPKTVLKTPQPDRSLSYISTSATSSPTHTNHDNLFSTPSHPPLNSTVMASTPTTPQGDSSSSQCSSMLQRQYSCPPAQQASMTIQSTKYRPSPLSRNVSGMAAAAAAPSTPTKSNQTNPSPSLAAAAPPSQPNWEQLWQVHCASQSYLRAHPHSASATSQTASECKGHFAGKEGEVGQPSQHMIARVIDSLQQSIAALSRPGEDEGVTFSPQQLNDILTKSQSHGIVHASAATYLKTPAAANDSLRGRPPIIPGTLTILNRTASAVPSRPASPFLANLKHLCIPAGPGEYPQAMASPGVQASPGPAGPGIKERMKWHLARQAGP